MRGFPVTILPAPVPVALPAGAEAAAPKERLAPPAAALAVDPPRQTPDLPVDGGGLHGTVHVDGPEVAGPAVPAIGEVARRNGNETPALSRECTPKGLIGAAGRKARRP